MSDKTEFAKGKDEGRREVFERFQFGCFHDGDRTCKQVDCNIETCPQLKGMI